MSAVDVPPTFAEAIPPFLRLFAPAAFTGALAYCRQSIALAAVGLSLSSTELAYFGLGLSLFNVAYAFVVGFAAATDSFGSQAYGRFLAAKDDEAAANTNRFSSVRERPPGSAQQFDYEGDEWPSPTAVVEECGVTVEDDPRALATVRTKQAATELGVVLQRSMTLTAAMCLAALLFFGYSDRVLPLILDRDMALGGSRFLRAAGPLFILNSVFVILQRTLQAQRVPEPSMIGSCASAVACPIICALVVRDSLEDGVLALTLCSAIAVSVAAVSAWVDRRVIVWSVRWPFHGDVIQWRDVKAHCAVGLPGLVASCAAYWAWEVFTLTSTSLGHEAVAVMAVTFTIVNTWWSGAQGIAAAATALIGNAFGANLPNTARRYAVLSVIAGVLFGSTGCLVLLVGGRHIYGLFTQDPAVVGALVAVTPVLIPLLFCDSLQVGSQASFRASGKQRRFAVVNICALWGVGIPVGMVCCFALGLGVKGLLIGLSSGMAALPLFMCTVAARMDFAAIAQAASEHTHAKDKT